MKKRILLTIILLGLAVTHVMAQETIHVLVALCDNDNQGIVKVPKGIGNGQDPKNNLYWGCGYGISTFFKRSANWTEQKRYKVDSKRLERIVFKHKTKDVYLVADAYDGRYIKDCNIDFLKSLSGEMKDTVMLNGKTIGINGNSKMVAYIGHNGLMDFSLPNTYTNKDNKSRDAIILACYSKRYFAPYFKSAKTNPVLWSTHLMSPEAYTLHDAIETYLKGETNEQIRTSAAEAYNKYQKCGIKGARNLLVSGY